MSGHNIKAIIVSTYGIAGLLAGVAALVFIGQYESARADNLTEILLFVVACIALGGFSLEGGKGNVLGLLLSILLLGTIENGMGLANIGGSVADAGHRPDSRDLDRSASRYSKTGQHQSHLQGPCGDAAARIGALDDADKDRRGGSRRKAEVLVTLLGSEPSQATRSMSSLQLAMGGYP